MASIEDRLRKALRNEAGEPPPLGAALERIRATYAARRRRRLAASAIAVSLVVLSGAVGLTRLSENHGARVRVGSSGSTTTQTVGPPDTTQSPVVATPTSPTPTSVTPEIKPEPMSITATSGSGSLVARATLPNKNIATAELVTLQVSAESRTGGIVSVGVDFGDGTPTSMPGPAVGAPCGPGPAPTQHAVGYDHAFRVSGTFTIVVMAVTDNCHGSERAQTRPGQGAPRRVADQRPKTALFLRGSPGALQWGDVLSTRHARSVEGLHPVCSRGSRWLHLAGDRRLARRLGELGLHASFE
jgi:hypothetical protein